MALALYSQKFWFPSGALAPGVVARVFLHDTNVLAPLWADAGGTVPVANPTVTDASAFLTFWIEEGTYWLHLDSESFEITVPAGSGGPFATVAQLAAHEADTTAVHGIVDTAALVVTTDPRLTDARTPTGAAGGDLAGTYPDPDVAAIDGVVLSGTPNVGDVLTATGAAAAQWTAPESVTPDWVFDITDPAYGAVGDAQVVGDGVMASGVAVLTSATANFPVGIVGKSISVKGAGVNGVTTASGTVLVRTSATQLTLSFSNASGGALANAVVIWGTNNQTAIQAATDAAEAYLLTHTYAQVYVPPQPFIVAGALNTSKSGNGQIVFGPQVTTAVKRILEFRGESDGAAAVRHWQQTVPQFAGSCLISFGVYASTAAQIASINAAGNPGVICGPNEGSGYGVGAVYSNTQAVLKNLAILTAHSAFGLTYGAFNFYGCANAHVANVGYGTAGTVAAPSTDYSSPGVFGTGLSFGALMPAPGNNDHCIAENVSCGGGYTYALAFTEHGVMLRLMILYCWAALCPVGTYFGSVGSVHAMDVISASIEACVHELYIIGPGSSGVGPTIYANISTESSTPNIDGNSANAVKFALGRVRLTGLFTESGVSTSGPCGIELVNGAVPKPIRRLTANFTTRPIDRTLVCDTSAVGAFTATLPAADFNPVTYVLHNIGANVLTVTTGTAQTITVAAIPGATSVAVASGAILRLSALFDGSAWGWFAV
jgi:hypothetical protein